MRKFYFLLAFLLCGVLAYGADGPREATFDKAASIEPTQQETLTSIRQTQTSTSDALSQGKVVAQQALPSAARNRVPARAASIDDVVGSRYLLAHANSTGIIHTNTAATVTRVTDDSVTIAGLIYSDVTVGAKLDLANGKVRVYPQHVVDIDDGPISIAPVDINNRIYSLIDPIEGTIENGNIHLDSPFGFFVTDGAKKGAYLTIGFLNYAYVATSNGTLNYNEIKFDTYLSTNRRTVTAKTDWVYVRQINPTQVRLVHMPTAFGYVDMDVNLGYDGKSATIDPQQLAYQSYVGWYNNYAMTETVTDTTVKISGTLLSPMQATFENGTLKTGKWMVGRLTSSSGSFANLFESSTISTTAAVTFPTMPALNLAGSGTEADPFLIKTPDDWYALSVAANNNAAYRSTTTQTDIAGEAYHTIAAGFYFKLANDIDLKAITRQFCQ